MEPKIVKTADGHKVEVDEYYYNSNGEQVFLDEVLVNHKGDVRFLVTPFYKGEYTAVSGAGGEHQEYDVPYEHEAMPVIINAIYKDEPAPLIGQAYAEKIETLARIAETIGELIIREQELKANSRKMEEAEKEKSKQIDELDKQIENKNKLLANKMEQLVEVKQKVNELEDAATTDPHNRGSFALVNREELIRLRKVAFKMECLEGGGVGDWEWYGVSLKKYFERYPNG